MWVAQPTQALAPRGISRCRGQRTLRVRFDGKEGKQEFSNDTKLRSEAQAPFRVFRQFITAAIGGSAAISTGVSFIQLVRPHILNNYY